MLSDAYIMSRAFVYTVWTSEKAAPNAVLKLTALSPFHANQQKVFMLMFLNKTNASAKKVD